MKGEVESKYTEFYRSYGELIFIFSIFSLFFPPSVYMGTWQIFIGSRVDIQTTLFFSLFLPLLCCLHSLLCLRLWSFV
ncbi:hypothetical protein BC829DRAFT_391999, partial [Chytridium lagenaria]